MFPPASPMTERVRIANEQRALIRQAARRAAWKTRWFSSLLRRFSPPRFGKAAAPARREATDGARITAEVASCEPC